MKVFKSLDGDMIKNSFKDMFVILNALKYYTLKNFFQLFYFFTFLVLMSKNMLITSLQAVIISQDC